MRTRSIRFVLRSVLLTGGILCFATGSAMAKSVADFYHGKTVEIDVGTGVGGGYDANARFVAKYLGRFIPGNPTIVVNNMPGGGGIRAANFLFHAARRDGSVIGTFSNAMITEPLLGTGQAKFQPSKFTWIGSVTHEDGICVARRSSGVTSWADLLHHELVVGTAAPGTTTYMFPVVLKNMFGAKFKLVSGYPDGAQIELALERGEIQGICQSYSTEKVKHPDWLRDHLVQPLIALGFGRLHDFPDLPSVMELAKTAQQKQILKVVLAPTLAGRPFLAPPGIPANRAEALQKAFAAMTKDGSFLQEARRRKIDVDPVSAQQMETLVKEIYALPADVIAATKRVVTNAGASK